MHARRICTLRAISNQPRAELYGISTLSRLLTAVYLAFSPAETYHSQPDLSHWLPEGIDDGAPLRDIARPAMPPSANGHLPADYTPMIASLWSRAMACESSPDLDASVVAHARQLCTAAREAGMRAEQLVLALKAHCRHECPPLHERRGVGKALAALVSLCIREFYRQPAVACPATADCTTAPLPRELAR